MAVLTSSHVTPYGILLYGIFFALESSVEWDLEQREIAGFPSVQLTDRVGGYTWK